MAALAYLANVYARYKRHHLFHQGDESAVTRLREILAESPPYISSVTELELFSFASTPEEQRALEQALLRVHIVPLFSDIARIAASFRRTCSIKTPDSAIAATALYTGSTLITRNVRDFKRVPGLILERI